MNDKWFAVCMIVFIMTLFLGSALLANCILLDEICPKSMDGADGSATITTDAQVEEIRKAMKKSQ